MYRMFKTDVCMEPYVGLKLNRFVKQALIKFRCGISEIAVHSQRYKRPEDQNLVCRLCGSSIENEVHFVLCCPYLKELRTEFILPKYCENRCQSQLMLLLSSTNEEIIRNLAIYLYKSIKKLGDLNT